MVAPKTTLNEEQAARLLAALDDSQSIHDLTDAQLSEAVLNEVWGKQYLFSRPEMLLSEMIGRFDKLAGVKRDEETGEITS
jgi:hypothetical protein